MKRKRVYAHRTLKMREEFLQWLRKRNALRQPQTEKQPDGVERASLLAAMAEADDGGDVS